MSISNVSVGIAFNVDELLTVELTFLFLEWVLIYCLGVYSFGFVPAVVRSVLHTAELLFFFNHFPRKSVCKQNNVENKTE